MDINVRDCIFDGLPGLTHNYAGLSQGNVASAQSALSVSYPKQAALQSLEKMHLIAQMGIRQAILPPQMRPNISVLRQIGYCGSDQQIWEKIWQEAPVLARTVCSASAMWAANAGTISAATETGDGRLHMTPANLRAMSHRALEAPQTYHLFQHLFADRNLFEVHSPLPNMPYLGDEGAANHTRFWSEKNKQGVDFFVYGHDDSGDDKLEKPQIYVARQAKLAQMMIARQHQLSGDKVLFAQQSPRMIDAGIFHNDVIATGQGNCLFYYQGAFADEPRVLDELRAKLSDDLALICVEPGDLSLPQIIRSYLFNSQWLVRPDKLVGADHSLIVILPTECQEDPEIHEYVTTILGRHPLIDKVIFMDLRQSMRNGGGPACLRLRIPMTEAQQAGVQGQIWMTETLYPKMCQWVDRFYRDRLSVEDLRDPNIILENQQALDELTQILHLGSVYDFQRV